MSANDDERPYFWEKFKSFWHSKRAASQELEKAEKESGWDRVKALFDVSKGKGPGDEIQHIPDVVFYTSVFAFLFGGQFGRRIVDDHFRRHNQLTVYNSVMHAKRQYQASVVLGFVKYGCRWGWRAGLFSGVYSFLLVAFKSYRNTDDALNYVASGASTGALYNIFSGWRKMVVGVVIGGGLCVPVGVIAHVGNAILPDEYKPKKQENAKKAEEWEQRLEVTSSFIQAMEKELNEDKNDRQSENR
ncbi:complex I assembly factor TIMMDC1, mitochondrial-like [Montipora foliosa]|uniref:complex I assembly factor TIMMDC1, mitochondrial-like n=1 Tax=Montipora foliosa TaxID=591990 RepID=UPI0035F15D32